MSKGKIYKAIVPITEKTVVIPVVFFPGIMATRLQNEDGDTIWDPDSKTWMLRNFYEKIEDATGREPKLKEINYEKVRKLFGFYENPIAEPIRKNSGYAEGQIERGFGECFSESYGKLLKYLDREFFEAKTKRLLIKQLNVEAPVEVIGYDWRKPPKEIVEDVKERLNELKEKYKAKDIPTDKVPFIIVTHSMGGLIARKLLQEDTKEGGTLEKQVLGVIHGNQPTIGAPKFYGYFKKGAKSVNFDTVKPSKNSFKELKETILSNAQGKTAVDFQYVVSSIPGALILLPTNDYKLRNDDGQISDEWITWEDGKDEKVIKNMIEKVINKTTSIYDYYKEKSGYIGLLSAGFYVKYAKSSPSSIKIKKDFFDSLKDAETFHKNMGIGKDIYAHPVTYEISISGLDTVVGVKFKKIGDDTKGKKDEGVDSDYPDVKLIFSSAGDETVPIYSQEILSNKHKDKVEKGSSNGVSHQDVYANHHVQEYIANKIEEILWGQFSSVYFEQGKSEITDEYKKRLDNLASIIIKGNKKNYKIIGYVSAEGDKKTNLKLAEDRAESVKKYIIKKLNELVRKEKGKDFDGSFRDGYVSPVEGTENDIRWRRVEIVEDKR